MSRIVLSKYAYKNVYKYKIIITVLLLVNDTKTNMIFRNFTSAIRGSLQELDQCAKNLFVLCGP